jgi:hypothetical protein
MPHVTHMLDIYSRLFSAVNCHTMGIKRFRLGLYCWRHFLQFSIISWMSVLLVEETRVTEENHRPVASHWQTLSHNDLHLFSELLSIMNHRESSFIFRYIVTCTLHCILLSYYIHWLFAVKDTDYLFLHGKPKTNEDSLWFTMLSRSENK